MKIAFLTRKSPYNKRSWSGSFYNMFFKLQKGNSIEWVKPGKRSMTSKFLLSGLSYWHKFTNVKKLNIVNEIYASSTAPYLNKQINKQGFNVIFAAASPELIANLDTKVPIIYFLDATFKQLAVNYPAYSNLPKWNYEQGIKVESAALHRANHIIVSSHWTKKAIENDFNVKSEKISVIGYGANMEEVPSATDVPKMIEKRINQDKSLKLLFVGKDWNRKGGQLALQAFEELNNLNIKTNLTIIGAVPPILPKKYSDLLTVIPNLDINKEEDFSLLYNYFKDANFFILPTRGDCTPIVFNEAAAFGLPVITTDVGGIKDVVIDGYTGKILSLRADGLDFANAIIDLYSDKDTYRKIAMQSRKRYEEYLNWDSWSKRTTAIMENLKNLADRGN